MPVEYHEAAEEELLHEIGYLEQRAKGLGRQVFAEVQRAEDLIAQFPESAAEIMPGMRSSDTRSSTRWRGMAY
jgi:plasmid stabilization system protein ParE